MFKSLSLLVLLLTMTFSAIAEPVNINTATAQQLDEALELVGPTRAEAIVAFRSDNGEFKTLEDFMKVPGIGPATMERNKDNIKLK